MINDVFITLGIVVLSIIIIYFITKMFDMQYMMIEGMSSGINLNDEKISNATGMATTYASDIKAEIIKMQDDLILSKYRSDYEEVITQLDELLGLLMIRQTLDIDIHGGEGKIIKSLEKLNVLKTAKDSVNYTMKYLDSM